MLASYALFPALYVVICILYLLSDWSAYYLAAPYLFLLLALYLVFFNVFLEDKATLLLREKQIAESERQRTELQTAITLSQIQPHFLYNALSGIAGLCGIEGANEARQAVTHFADYLRGNLDSLRSSRNIPFRKELEHIRTYLWIEKLRFEDDLVIAYDIAFDDFSLPPLTVQPLVENAVKHGVCRREEGGTVKLSTRREGDTVLIIVEDDGVGFDPTQPPEDGRKHVGIDNVRARLDALCGGTLTIESEPGRGTRATITLPEESL